MDTARRNELTKAIAHARVERARREEPLPDPIRAVLVCIEHGHVYEGRLKIVAGVVAVVGACAHCGVSAAHATIDG